MKQSRIENELYLKRYEEMYMDAEEAKQNLEAYMVAVSNPKGQVITGMPFGGGGKSDQSDVQARLETLKREYKIASGMEERRKKIIQVAISKLDDPAEHLVIQMRYLEFKGWKEISQYIGKKLRQTHNIHVKALNNLRL